MRKRWNPDTDTYSMDGEPCDPPTCAPHIRTGYCPPASGAWPIVSEAAGCHPEQVKEHMEFDQQHRVPTEYTRDGSPVFTDRAHRKRYLKAHGLVDKDGVYGG